MNSLKKIALIGCGSVCVALGFIGIFLPILPTTPFLLLAAVCYARSSRRFYIWLITNRWCGTYIRNYREGRGITRRHKTITLLLLWATIGYSAGIVVTLWWVRLMLLCIALAVSLHVLTIKTCKSTPPDSILPAAPKTCQDDAIMRKTTCQRKAPI